MEKLVGGTFVPFPHPNRVNDLIEGFSTNGKLFANYTSLFSVTHDSQRSAKDRNEDLEMTNNWTFQWKINSNTGRSKRAQQDSFTSK